MARRRPRAAHGLVLALAALAGALASGPAAGRARAQDRASGAADAVARPDSAVYPLVVFRGAPYVELELGGARGLFLFDTGANTSGVDGAWLARTGARYRDGGAGSLGGTTGGLRTGRAVFERLPLGRATFRDATFHVQSFAHFASPPAGPQVGLLGTDFIGRYQVTLDWVAEEVTLRLAHERARAPAGATALALAHPLGLPTVGVRLAGVDLPCRLDTGATTLGVTPQLDVNEAAVAALRAAGVPLEPAGTVRLAGVGGAVSRRVLRAPGGHPGLVLDVGPGRVEGVRLVVHGADSTLGVPYPLALAGCSVLRPLHRLVLDPFDHLLWVWPTPRRKGPRRGPV